jgi:hypothetical protein
MKIKEYLNEATPDDLKTWLKNKQVELEKEYVNHLTAHLGAAGFKITYASSSGASQNIGNFGHLKFYVEYSTPFGRIIKMTIEPSNRGYSLYVTDADDRGAYKELGGQHRGASVIKKKLDTYYKKAGKMK